MTTDATNPDHYRSHPSGVECIEITRHMSFDLGNAVKYIWRADLKHQDGGLEDLRKAAWYIADEIKRREAANTPDRPTTPEPETSPAKPGSSASQGGLRVGARVRVRAGGTDHPSQTPSVGTSGVILRPTTAELGHWLVQLDGGRRLGYFEDELEAIG